MIVLLEVPCAWVGFKKGQPPAQFMEDEIVEDEGHDDLVHCVDCAELTAHEVLRSVEKGEGVDHLVRCLECSKVSNLQLRPPKAIMVRFTLSDGAESFPVDLEVDDDERFRLGEEFEHDDASWVITRLESEEGRSLKRVEAKDVKVVWATRRDLVRVKMTFTDGEHSYSDEMVCEPGVEFYCGSMLEHGGRKWRIRALHSGRGRKLNGGMKAAKIRRMFLHLPPSKEDLREKESKRRGRWKGQDFEGREEHQRMAKDSNIRRDD